MKMWGRVNADAGEDGFMMVIGRVRVEQTRGTEDEMDLLKWRSIPALNSA
jgi:hypothetical protein